MESRPLFNGYALLIGVDENRVQRWALPSIRNDISALQRALVDPDYCAYPWDKVRLVTGKQATRGGILSALEWLAKSAGQGGPDGPVSLVYYAGHIWQSADANLGQSMIPYDVDADDIQDSTLDLVYFLIDFMFKIKNRLLLIVDRCPSITKDLSVEIIPTPYERLGGTVRDSRPFSYLHVPSKIDNWKILVPATDQYAALQSTSYDQTSYPRKDGRLSIFMYNLIGALTGSFSPDPQKPEVEVSDLTQYVKRRVMEDAKDEWGEIQEAQFETTGDFPIALLRGGRGFGPNDKPPDPMQFVISREYDAVSQQTGTPSPISQKPGSPLEEKPSSPPEEAGPPPTPTFEQVYQSLLDGLNARTANERRKALLEVSQQISSGGWDVVTQLPQLARLLWQPFDTRQTGFSAHTRRHDALACLMKLSPQNKDLVVATLEGDPDMAKQVTLALEDAQLTNAQWEWLRDTIRAAGGEVPGQRPAAASLPPKQATTKKAEPAVQQKPKPKKTQPAGGKRAATQPGQVRPAGTRASGGAPRSTPVVLTYVPPPKENLVKVTVAGKFVTLQYGNDEYRSPYRPDPEKLVQSPSPKEYGEVLFGSLIHDQAAPGFARKSTFRGYAAAVDQARGKLRFELELQDTDLQVPKWEYLKDPEDDSPLAAYQDSPFYRRFGSVKVENPIQGKLRVLVVVSTPPDLKANRLTKDLVPIDLKQELDIVASGLKRLETARAIEYHVLTGEAGQPLTLERLTQELEKDYHILHLIAHGMLNPPDLQGFYLVLEGPNRQPRLVKAEEVRSTCFGKTLRLVVLASCQSAVFEQCGSVRSLGPQLVSRGVPAVIAMQELLQVDVAQYFTQHFYDDLARCGRADMAMAATRNALLGEYKLSSWKWGVPVLLMGTEDGKLFDVPKGQLKDIPPLHPNIRPYEQLDGEGDPLVRILSSLAAQRGAGAGIVEVLRQVDSGAIEASAMAQAQDRPELSRLLTDRVNLQAQELKDYARSSASALEIPLTVFEQVASALNTGKHIILIGPPGTGKTSLAIEICNYADSKKFSRGRTVTTATADWTTFDTVGGYIPTRSQVLQFRPGIFLEAVRQASWLVIDEINRAEIDKAFGELFTLLSGQGVDLPYIVNDCQLKVLPFGSLDLQKWVPKEATRGYHYVMHPNWRIIGTMNVYDKSMLYDMSLAFMRRFAFIDVQLPEKNTYLDLVKRWFSHRSMKTKDITAFFENLLDTSSTFMSYRALGPAIVRDMVHYADDRRSQLQAANPVSLLGEAFLLYVSPQLDGLDRKVIMDIAEELKTLFKGEEPEVKSIRTAILDRIKALYPHIPNEEWEKHLGKE